MAQDREDTWKNLKRLWESQKVKKLSLVGEKYVVMSDFHLGDGSGADDFRNNVPALKSALQAYIDGGFILILLGDIEELWQFDLSKIQPQYQEIYEILHNYREHVFRVFGNHDIDWSLRDPILSNGAYDTTAHEALKLVEADGEARILLLHGHQGSKESDKSSWFSRFVVRGVFRPIEPFVTSIGLYGHSSATKSQVAKDYERIFYTWAKENGVIVICGHSHRAIHASRTYTDQLRGKIAALQAENITPGTRRERIESNIKEISKLSETLREEVYKGREIEPVENGGSLVPCYFNSGCALYTDGLTALEIADDTIKLVKWNNTGIGPEAREEYYQEDTAPLSELIDRVTQNNHVPVSIPQ